MNFKLYFYFYLIILVCDASCASIACTTFEVDLGVLKQGFKASLKILSPLCVSQEIVAFHLNLSLWSHSTEVVPLRPGPLPLPIFFGYSNDPQPFINLSITRPYESLVLNSYSSGTSKSPSRSIWIRKFNVKSVTILSLMDWVLVEILDMKGW